MNRFVAFGILVLAFSASFQLGSMYEHTEEGAQDLVQQFMETVRGIDGIGIFWHNLSLALPMFIPGFGTAWGLFAGWSTGFTLSALTTTNPELGGIQPLALLYLSPFGIMELAAYSLAASRSLLLALRIYRKQALRPQLKPTLIEVGIVCGLLLAGGLVEYHIIELAGGWPDPSEPT